MTIKSFDKGNLKAVRSDIATALATVETKYGIKLDLGNISFSDKEFRGKINGSVTYVNKTFDTNIVVDADFVRSVARDRFLPAVLVGRKFRAAGRVFTLTGVKNTRPKYPFQGQGSQGGNYKFSIDQVANGLI